jgi:hypothetical protein
VRVDSNVNRIKLQFGNLVDGIEEKAMVRAMNRAGDQSLTAAKREISQRYRISARAASSQIKVRYRARRGRLFFTIRIFGKRIPLIEFARGSHALTVARKRRGPGVTVEVRKGHRKMIPRSFIAQMASGHVGVFARIIGKQRANAPFRFGPGSGQPGRKWGAPDLKIGELTTIAVPGMFLEKSVRKAVAQVAMDSFNRNFEQQLKFLTSKAA